MAPAQGSIRPQPRLPHPGYDMHPTTADEPLLDVTSVSLPPRSPGSHSGQARSGGQWVRGARKTLSPVPPPFVAFFFLFLLLPRPRANMKQVCEMYPGRPTSSPSTINPRGARAYTPLLPARHVRYANQKARGKRACWAGVSFGGAEFRAR